MFGKFARLCFLHGSLVVGLLLAAVPVAQAQTVVPKDAATVTPDPSDDLMRALMTWAAPKVDLPTPDTLPTVVRKTHCELQQIFYQRPDCDENGMSIVAMYDANVMWLRDDWRSDDLMDVSTLLHELIHHMQFHAAVERSPCAAEAIEKPAYEAQIAFLEAAGVNAHSKMGINGLSLIFLTNCLAANGGM